MSGQIDHQLRKSGQSTVDSQKLLLYRDPFPFTTQLTQFQLFLHLGNLVFRPSLFLSLLIQFRRTCLFVLPSNDFQCCEVISYLRFLSNECRPQVSSQRHEYWSERTSSDNLRCVCSEQRRQNMRGQSRRDVLIEGLRAGRRKWKERPLTWLAHKSM